MCTTLTEILLTFSLLNIDPLVLNLESRLDIVKMYIHARMKLLVKTFKIAPKNADQNQMSPKFKHFYG